MDEKHEGSTLAPTDRSESESLPRMKEFVPINTSSKANSRPGSQGQIGPSSLHSVSRTRSQNGYGCDDDDDDVEQVASHDPFEVRWDGESDPMNPRSWNKARKWAVVIIVSASSICV